MRVLETIFARLADPKIEGMPRIKAVIELLMLIRFPKGDLEYEAAVLQSSAMYLKLKGHSSLKLAEASDSLEFLFQDIDIKHFIKITSFCQQVHIGFDLIEFRNSTIVEHDIKYISEIIKFILWFEPTINRHDKRKYASLHKAYLYLYLWSEEELVVMISRNSFQSLWDKYVSISCLIYAFSNYSDKKFVLNPEHKDFHTDVDFIANDRQLTNRIIGVASCAYARLKKRLRRLSKPIDWPDLSRWEYLSELPTMILPQEVAERVEQYDFEVPYLTREERRKYGIKPMKNNTKKPVR